DVFIFRRYVVVPQDSQPRVALELILQPRMQRLEPGQFVLVLVAADRLSVWTIGADHPDVAYYAVQRRCDDALLMIFVSRQVPLHVCANRRTDDSHAVISFLSCPVSLVTDLCKGIQRKVFVGKLELLQA